MRGSTLYVRIWPLYTSGCDVWRRSLLRKVLTAKQRTQNEWAKRKTTQLHLSICLFAHAVLVFIGSFYVKQELTMLLPFPMICLNASPSMMRWHWYPLSVTCYLQHPTHPLPWIMQCCLLTTMSPCIIFNSYWKIVFNFSLCWFSALYNFLGKIKWI